MVGVSGVRGLVGQSLTPALVLEFAQAFGALLSRGKVALARDSRPSGQMYASAAAAGLASVGCRVTNLGIAMTPTVGRTIVEGGFDGGVSITASHNPAPWNGIKFLDSRGLAPDAALAARIASFCSERHAASAAPSSDTETSSQETGPRPVPQLIREDFAPITDDSEAGRRHVRDVLSRVEVATGPLSGLRVVLDSVNGAGCRDTPELFAGLGCELIHVNNEPNGLFAHAPEPIAENLTQLSEAVREKRAAVGFAQDPDADRLAIVDENGRYIGEECTLALAARSVLMRRPGPVAANLSTSRMIDEIARPLGVRVVRTPVGEANVARGMLENKCVIGGEGNGGVIDPRITLVRDSLSAISLVLQLMAATGKSISALVAELPRFAMVKEKIECPRARIAAAVERLKLAFARFPQNDCDGVRIDFPHGWVHVRASNTEPIMRIIAEARDVSAARELIAQVRARIGT